MKILLHGINYWPELTGIGKYTGELANWLAEAGHEVRVVVAPPYYPQWRIAERYANRWSVSAEQAGKPRVYRCPLWVPSRPSGFKRVLHLASFALSSFPVMMRQIFWKPDVVLAVEPPLFCAPQAWLAARLSRARAWLHIQDFEVDAAFDLGMLQAEWLRRYVLGFEGFWLCRFDRVSTISGKMLENLAGKGVATDRVIFFPNWVDPEEIHPMEQASPFREQLGLRPDQFVALYSGNMGEKQGLEVVLDAAAKLQGNADIHFVLCGDGAAKARLRKKYDIVQNVTWLPLQPAERLNDLLNLADVHLLPQRGDVADLVMPSKLLGMLASGRPSLATASADTQLGEIVAQCGVLSPVADAPAFAQALQKLAGDPALRERLGAAGRVIAVKRFSRETVLRQFERELTEALGA